MIVTKLTQVTAGLQFPLLALIVKRIPRVEDDDTVSTEPVFIFGKDL